MYIYLLFVWVLLVVICPGITGTNIKPVYLVWFFLWFVSWFVCVSFVVCKSFQNKTIPINPDLTGKPIPNRLKLIEIDCD